jgi:hypothetical protein
MENMTEMMKNICCFIVQKILEEMHMNRGTVKMIMMKDLNMKSIC